ncbi:MAG: SAM-dependent chlorinase/fluorinase [Flavobacteriales bacterium]|nr:SAM-dependent chlorinase/fluorinase [Flavobacteriales bacterium]
MSIITLTTDLGLKDYYVSSIKASILTQCPDATIIDISHNVPKFDIAQAAFMVKNAMKDFPSGTIHILGVKPAASATTPHIAMYINGQYFIGADNGIFSLIFDQDPEKVVELTISQDTDLLTFPTKDVFVKAACHIARGGTLEIIGGPKDAIIQRSLFRAVVNGGTIRGTVIYVDSYGNVVTNINEPLYKEVGKGKPFTIYFRESRYRINHIVKNYNQVEDGDALALFGATGYLEIAINSGNAGQLLGLDVNETIRIEFEG